ncbi:MAG: hypothetical protein ACTTKH_04405 [Treponema sp.]
MCESSVITLENVETSVALETQTQKKYAPDDVVLSCGEEIIKKHLTAFKNLAK